MADLTVQSKADSMENLLVGRKARQKVHHWVALMADCLADHLAVLLDDQWAVL
jgi:hypothetical protein